MKPLFVNAQVEVSEDVLHDFAEGQGDDCQIVAPKAKDRNADKEADGSRQHAAYQHGNHQPEDTVGNRLGKQGGNNHAGESADAHKARMTQAQLTADAN